LLIKLLGRIAPPNHTRDYLATTCVAQDLRRLFLLSASGLVAGVYGVTVWESRMGHLLVEVAGATIVVGILHAGAIVRRLQREMRFRWICRGMRMALPPALANGIAAAEREDISSTAEAIAFRVQKSRELDVRFLAVFDVLLADILDDRSSVQKFL